MTAETFFQLFNQYGLILVCAVVFCEYMNLPGFPAGVIMPCVGVLIARSELSAADGFSERGRRCARQSGHLRRVLLGRRTGDGETVRQEQEIQVTRA